MALVALSVDQCSAQPALHTQTFSALSGASLSESAGAQKSDNEESADPKKPPAIASARLRLKQAKLHFDSGCKFQKTGDTGRALIEFLKASREDPKLVDAYYEQALIFREKGFHKLAVSRLEQALVIRPKYQKARLLLATIKLEQGNVTGAVEQLGETLGLSKSNATSIKPEAEKGDEDQIGGVAPMILQSVHPAMKPPAVHRLAKSKESEESQVAAADLKEHVLAPSRPAKRRPTSRKKIREFIARRYRKSDGRRPQKHWIARIFTWPEPFKSFDGGNTGHADYNDLQPKGDDLSLAKEFKEDCPDFVPDESTDEPELPSRKTNRTLLAYNGPAASEAELIRKLPEITEADNSSRAERRPSAPAQKESTPVMEEKKTVEHNSTASSDRTTKLASRGWSDNAPEQESPASNALNFHPARKKTQAPPQVPDDEWTKRLRYLNEHGTSTLKKGEAFMFYEDTGEAVLFLSDGQRIRRMIAAPIDSQEIMKSRRPDVLQPKQLFFNTSLLGTMVGSPPPPELVRPQDPTTNLAPVELPPEPPGFKIEQMMDNPTGFMNWVKGLINL